jgi:hypothetical protein
MPFGGWHGQRQQWVVFDSGGQAAGGDVDDGDVVRFFASGAVNRRILHLKCCHWWFSTACTLALPLL